MIGLSACMFGIDSVIDEYDEDFNEFTIGDSLLGFSIFMLSFVSLNKNKNKFFKIKETFVLIYIFGKSELILCKGDNSIQTVKKKRRVEPNRMSKLIIRLETCRVELSI